MHKAKDHRNNKVRGKIIIVDVLAEFHKILYKEATDCSYNNNNNDRLTAFDPG